MFALNWMSSVEDFEDDVSHARNQTYMSTLTKSLSAVLHVFYENIKTVGVSAVTGEGIHSFFQKLNDCKKEYYLEYQPFMIGKKNERIRKQKIEEEKEMMRLRKDVESEQSKKEMENIHSVFNESDENKLETIEELIDLFSKPS